MRYSQSIDDDQLMELALRLGRRCSGATAENPAVGCVITHPSKGGVRIVGKGWTQRGGRPHAERAALAEAGDLARGATAYVTLEPCSHHGRTSPCAEALIEAGIARVVCAHADPDVRVSGNGFAMLRKSGIKVETGVLEATAHRDLAGFLSRTVRGRPWLQVKMALSPDGMIGRQGEGNYPVTGPVAKARTFALRARADAIMLGVDTVLADDPSLSVRLPGLEDRSPIRVILDSTGRTPLTSKLVNSARDLPVWIITTGAISADKALDLEDMGCRILLVDDTPDGHLDLKMALNLLAGEGVNKLFAECGARLSKALLEQRLVDEFILYLGSKAIGETGISALGGNPQLALTQAGFFCEKTEEMKPDRMQIYLNPESLRQLYGRNRQCSPE